MRTLTGICSISKICIGFLAILVTSPVVAHDLGVHGSLFPIAEPDIRDVMMEQIKKVDWDKINNGMVDSAKTYLDRLPSAGLPRALETKTIWVDPSVIASSDISAPVKKEDGSYQWEVIVPAGSKVNPLEKITTVQRMLFFDAADADQVDFAVQALKKHKVALDLVLTGGNIKDVANLVGRPVFHANSALLAKAKVDHVPALVGQGRGTHSSFIATTEIALPSKNADLIEQIWFGMEQPIPSEKSND